MSGTILRRRDRTARPPRVEHYSSAVNKNRDLRQVNEILRKASAYFAQAELDRRFKS